MRILFSTIIIILMLTSFPCIKTWGQLFHKTSDLQIRDPFILANKEDQTYYLYAARKLTPASVEKNGVDIYTSKDLKNWSGPVPVLDISNTSWASKLVWAPEVHLYNGKYYLFVTLTAHDSIGYLPLKPTMYKRGTQIFYSNSPQGPFIPFRNKAHTSENWMSLDGTLWIENSIPYMVFCHEWVQTTVGTIDLIELKKNLSATRGSSSVLFKASEAKWATDMKEFGWLQGYVTDGPFLYKTKSGCLLMLWSTFGKQGYCMGVAKSPSGSIKGPWLQNETPLYTNDGGHGMVFTTFENQLLLVLHQSNQTPMERMRFFTIAENGCDIEIKEKTE